MTIVKLEFTGATLLALLEISIALIYSGGAIAVHLE